MSYVEPVNWIAGDVASPARLNAIQDNIRALKTPPYAIANIRSGGVNVTTTSTTLAGITAELTSLPLTTTGGKLTFAFTGTFSHSSSSQAVLDVLIDGTTYLSSMAGVGLVYGTWMNRVTTTPTQFSSVHVLPAGVLAAGAHTFSLQWRILAGTLTLVVIDYLTHFAITE